jgi:hypothetical protein
VQIFFRRGKLQLISMAVTLIYGFRGNKKGLPSSNAGLRLAHRWARTKKWFDFRAVGWHPVADIARHWRLPTVPATLTISPTTKWLNSLHNHWHYFPDGPV